MTIEVEAGDVFVVFGPSGSGKSSLLRLLNRLNEPTSHLDTAAADRVEALLADVMAAYSLTAVLVTYDAVRARRSGTRGVRPEDGRVVCDGPLETIVEEA